MVNSSEIWEIEKALTNLSDNADYKKAVPLGLQIIPSVAQEKGFATSFVQGRYDAFVGGGIDIQRYQETLAVEDMDIFTVVDPAKKDKEYYTKKGQGHLYQEALEGLLKVYNLSFDMILWSDLLLEELILDRKLSSDKPSDFNAYISSVVDRYIESKEKEMTEAYNVLNGLPEKKQSLIGKIFK